MDVVVSDKGALFLLPDPVTCFRSASYNQIQTFRLADDASLVVLDWVTSGRKSLGEEWAFSRYYSANDVWVGDRRVAKDVTLLEDTVVDAAASTSLPRRTLFDKLSPYSCYATVILYGPLVQNVVRGLHAQYQAIVVFKTASPADLLWSLSAISEGKGCVVRVAGKETEGVKVWLGGALRRLEDLVGVDVFRRAFA
jgi:urease accessory protein